MNKCSQAQIISDTNREVSKVDYETILLSCQENIQDNDGRKDMYMYVVSMTS